MDTNRQVMRSIETTLESTLERISALVDTVAGVLVIFGGAITVSLYDADEPVAVISGEEVYKNDVLTITGATTVIGATSIGSSRYRVDGGQDVEIC